MLSTMRATGTSQEPISFPLGKCYATPGTSEEFPRDVILSCIDRHARGDWGDLSEYDIQANNDAILNGGRLLSSYNIRGDKLWIITDAERETTTICLPEEY